MKSEKGIHFFWKYTKYPRNYRLIDGREITVFFPGEHNRSRGPDFKKARLEIDGKTLIGSVEIHLVENDWKAHSHHLNLDYGQILLHVFLRQSKSPEAIVDPPTLSLRLEESEVQEFLTANKISESSKIDPFPGNCGFQLTPDQYPRLKRLILSAAEERISIKADEILQRVSASSKPPEDEIEEILFQKIFRALGYSAFSDAFEQLAMKIPLQILLPRIRQTPVRENVFFVLALWIKNLGWEKRAESFLEKESSFFHHLKQAIQSLPDSEVNEIKAKKSRRPENNPFKRLCAMYFHLHSVQENGMLQTWLRLISEGQFLDSEKKFHFGNAQKLFEPKFEGLIPKTLIHTSTGKDKLMAVWANAIIPCFLAYAKQMNEKSLEQKIIEHFLNLPPEGENQKTKYMESRLGIRALKDLSIRKNLSYYQGLIQIRDESCEFDKGGCENCSFLKLLR